MNCSFVHKFKEFAKLSIGVNKMYHKTNISGYVLELLGSSIWYAMFTARVQLEY